MLKTICASLAFATAAAAAPIDGAGVTLNDPLLDKLVGHWSMTGTLAGRAVKHDVDAQWVLNHQFLQIHEIDTKTGPDGKPGYEAMPMVGYDNASERYVAHWIDVFGGRWSETLGYGTKTGDAISFVFEYPDGPFRTTFRRDGGGWRWSMVQKNAQGEWKTFAEMTLTPR